MGGYVKSDGFEVPRCTQIASLGSSIPLQWSSNEAVGYIRENCVSENMCWQVWEKDLEAARFHYKAVSKEALRVGSEVHDAIEKFWRGEDRPELSCQESINAYSAFIKWHGEQDEIVVLGVEERVESEFWAGTLDLQLVLNGERGVIDYKTSKPPLRPAMRYQTAAYRSTDPKNVFHAVLRLDKYTGEYQYKDFRKTYEKDLDTFNKLLIAYFAQHPIIAKKAGWEG